MSIFTVINVSGLSPATAATNHEESCDPGDDLEQLQGSQWEREREREGEREREVTTQSSSRAAAELQ